MADYNVNMKQWNGTSFDNVLPLAYNAKQLGGQSLAEVKQWVQDNNLLLYTGQYTGTGTYGSSNPTSITFPFEPIILLTPFNLTMAESRVQTVLPTQILRISYTNMLFAGQDHASVKKSADGKTISWYNTSGAYQQCNESGTIYYFAAIGGYDMGGQTEWMITQSCTWAVPRTGRYYIELYGGGGSSPYNSHWVGGSSCQTFDSITLTKGDVISITVGKANSGATDGTTKFGQYSVQGATAATDSAIGKGSGNKGKDGWYDQNQNVYNYSDGEFGKRFGFGRNYAAGAGQGAVYLKYLGA